MLTGARIRQHQERGQAPPQHCSTEHERRKPGREVEEEQQARYHGREGNARRLFFETGQACPLPGAQGHHQADEQGETRPFEQEETAQGNRQQDQRSDDALFKH